MKDNLQQLSQNLAGWCTFISDKYRLLLIAPPKCGSTSIFKALYDKLVEPSQAYERDFSHEYAKELCIHKHLKKSQDCSADNLRRIFADSSYKKILVVRDPIDRLCSAICSKYLIKSTPHYKHEIIEKRPNAKPFKQPYTRKDDFLDDFNEIANILITKGSIFEKEKASHAAPITEIIPKPLLAFFNEIIDITNKDGWISLENIINQHLNMITEAPRLDKFPHINENPLSNGRRFLSLENYALANRRYSEDFSNLKILPDSSHEHHQSQPSQEELKSLNTFISLTSRTIDIFMTHSSIIQSVKAECKKKINAESMKNSSIKIKNKQLTYLEELSRRTAEQLLIESRELKSQKIKLEERLETLSTELNKLKIAYTAEKILFNRYFPYYEETKELDLRRLIRRAEKRIKNKNYRSARELLLQVYCMDKTKYAVLLRLFATLARNPLLRSVLLLITFPAKRANLNIKGDEN